MSNSLTSLNGLDQAYWSKQSSTLTNIQSSINNKEEKKLSFSKMLDEKVNMDKKINEKKLSKKQKKLYDSCVEMESLFWKQVLNSMKKTINKYKLLDGGQAEEIFSDFLYDEYATMMAKNSSSNISDTIYKQLSGHIA